MDQKKTCEICNRQYKLNPTEDDSVIPGTSSFYIRLREPNKTTMYAGGICPGCARELLWKVKTMRRNAPKKCDFCDYHRGPLHHENPRTECRHCSNYSNFKLKKHMTNIDKIRWDHFNGDLDVDLKGEYV